MSCSSHRWVAGTFRHSPGSDAGMRDSTPGSAPGHTTASWSARQLCRRNAVAAAVRRLEAILAASKGDPLVIERAIYALGHAWAAAAAVVLLAQVPVTDPHPDVRLAFARALPGGVAEEDELRDRAIHALVVLSRADDPEVRDWAVFGLGQIDADTPGVRDALAARLDDSDDDARCEALVALARTGDPRALEALLDRLEDTATTVWMLELEAASALAHPTLHAPLVALAGGWGDVEDEFAVAVRLAIARCHPGADAH